MLYFVLYSLSNLFCALIFFFWSSLFNEDFILISHLCCFLFTLTCILLASMNLEHVCYWLCALNDLWVFADRHFHSYAMKLGQKLILVYNWLLRRNLICFDHFDKKVESCWNHQYFNMYRKLIRTYHQTQSTNVFDCMYVVFYWKTII